MNSDRIATQGIWRLPRLAATGVICLFFGMNTHAGAVSTLPATMSAATDGQHGAIGAVVPGTNNLQVLSSSDESLYRAIFAAQARGDWKTADGAVIILHNKGLMGHVMADRYMRREATAVELKSWLASYARLPEADDIYDEARSLPNDKGGGIGRPQSANIWSGGDSYATSFGFQTETVDHGSAIARRFDARVSQMLRHGDPYGAEDALYTELLHRGMPSDEIAATQARIAAGYFYDGAYTEAHDLALQSAPTGNPLGLWIAGLTSWKRNDIRAAADYFTKLASQPDLPSSDKSASAFWAFRALNRAGDTAHARAMLAKATEQPRTFYGLMATALNGHEDMWSWDLPATDIHDLDALQKTPAGWRALALIQVGQKDLAESELRRLNPQGHRDLQNAMLDVAERNQMPSLALQIGGVATGENGKRYDAALYPVPPWQPEKGFSVDRALLYALMRRESSFNPGAVSGAGACGLMQLMPQTANLVAQHRVASENDCSAKILDPAYNMSLGQEYVRRLAQVPTIGDNLLFLLAAYNSGPGKLAHWKGQQAKDDPLMFVESLPLHETRDYVQQVLMHYWTYRARLNEPETSLQQLAKGQWPRYALRDEARGHKAASANGIQIASSVK